MATFDLGRFRDLAFARPALPDHPLQSVNDARQVLAEIAAGDPDKALADITNWVAGMNAAESFTPGRRARILLALDEAARPLWRVKSENYLLPDGPGGRRGEGDASILRALFDSASEFAAGFETVLTESADPDRSSRWVEENHVLIHARNMRWLARRLALSHMLRLDSVGAIWERTHRLYHLAEEYEVARIPVSVFAGDRVKSSVRQEYTHMLLLELASPEGMKARDIELAFRIARNVAGSVRLEAERSTEAPFCIVPEGASRPGPAALAKGKPGALYIASLAGLPRLRDMLERDRNSEDAAPDTLYGHEYTVGQRRALIKRLLEYWGADAPQRRNRRVPLASKARIVAGFERVVEVIPALDKNAVSPEEARRDLQLSIDDTTRTLSRAKLRAAQSIGSARVIDASNGGLGLAISRGDASWARLGAIVAVAIEPGSDWLVGVLRRLFALDKELRLGIQVLSKAPRVLMINPGSTLKETTWEDAVKYEATYRERYRKAILLEATGLPLVKGDLLLPPRLAAEGEAFGVPLPGRNQNIAVTRLLDDGEHYQRAAYEARA